MENESCRILTISSTIEVAAAFIESVKALAASRSTSSSTIASPSSPPEKLSVPLTIPWTITNRYYVADVHFSAWTMDRLFLDLFDRQPPALVFVWYEGESYVKHVKEIARLMKLREYEPEVALAVRIPRLHTFSEMENEETTDGLGEGENENGDVDSTLLSYGFEYVDATRPLETSTEDGLAENGMEDDIPALPRVLDALSTIIWPSMRSNKLEPGVSGPKIPLDFNRSFDEIDFEDEDLEKEREGMLHELLQETKQYGLSASPVSSEQGDEAVPVDGGKVDEDQEFIAQMQAIILDAEAKNQWNRPWLQVSAPSSTTASLSEMRTSPTELNSMSPFESHLSLGGEAVKERVSLRFEDDFSVFVSAPPQEEDKPASWTGLESMGFLAPDDGFRYRTLGSVSDFGGSDEERPYDRLDDEDPGSGEDDGMPSKQEIKETALKIFGGPSHMVNQREDGQGFDLEQVFGVLQEYKTEIAGMADEEEKRKAAARVALGLVYGL